MAHDRARLTEVLADIPTFVAVVEAGSFAAAARRVSLSRSAVGKSIARLEDRLGTRLFHRTTRTSRLTDDGTAFYERCLRALDELMAGRAQLESGRRVVEGRLRVSMPVLFGRLCVAPVLARLAIAHPRLSIDAHFSDRMVDLIEDRVDLAVRMRTPGDGADLVTRRIAQEETVICASPRYLAQRGTPASPSGLADHHAITYAFGDGRTQAWKLADATGTFVACSPPSRLRFGDLASIADAATEGLGLAWLPTWLVGERLRTGALVRVMAEQPALVSDVHLVWMRSRHLPSRIRAAIDACVDEVPRHLGT